MLAVALALPWFGGVMLALVDGRRRGAAWLAAGCLGLALGVLAVLLGMVIADGPLEGVAGGWPSGVGITLRADALGALFALTSVAVLVSALVYEVAAGIRSPRFPALVLLLATGLTGLFLTADVFSFYVFFELSMIASYVLAAYGDKSRQLTAGFIFAVVNLLGSFLFLIGVAAIYHVTGSLDMATVAERLQGADSGIVLLIAVAIFVAFGVKLGLFPFHFWLPTVYTSATPAVAAMLSGAVANIGSYGLLRFGAGVMPEALQLGAPVLIGLGTASILYGALQSVSRRSAAEVLAYSAVGQAGYVLVTLSVAGAVGLTAAVVYAIANALNKALLFLSLEVRGWAVGLVFAVGAFSVAGVPPTAGFFGKVEVFRAGVTEDSVALVALLFLGGALSFLYMFQIYQHDFWREQRRTPASGRLVQAVPIVLMVLVVALGLWPEPLLRAGQEAAEAVQEGGP